MAKWSSRGGTVCLLDLQEQALQGSLKYVQQLRATNRGHDGNWGEVKISPLASLESTLEDAWLAIEV